MNLKQTASIGMIALGLLGGFTMAEAAGHSKRAETETAIQLPVNINTATAAELKAVKSGLGPKKAQEIVDYRTSHGNFKSVDDLRSVKGFSAGLLERLKGKLTV